MTLRLAVTDYDGENALEFLGGHEEATRQEFVEAACPRIAAAGKIISDYIAATG